MVVKWASAIKHISYSSLAKKGLNLNEKISFSNLFWFDQIEGPSDVQNAE